MKTSKEFRNLVVRTEDQFKSGSLNGTFLVLREIDQIFPTNCRHRTAKLCVLVERIIQNRTGHLTFKQRENLKANSRLHNLVIKQYLRNLEKKNMAHRTSRLDATFRGKL
ncbi:hypothetical protein ACPV5O_11475 [Vibrio maritimus]|uniref:hypothetical protein n=1 Tax=Vibrio maritimus TaxID=990268 RepID=UPI00406947F9